MKMETQKMVNLGEKVLFLTLFAGSLIASAQTKPELVDGNTVLNPIEIKGHFDTGIGTSDAASQGVVLSKTIEDQAFLRPGEVMETVPGLVVTQHSGDGKANQYFLRGYNLDHGTDFSTSIDGVQANMPTHAHGQGYADLNYMIPELIDHIDYRKGTYFAENGDFSSAGSADVVYKKSLSQNIFNLSLGSFGYKRALIATSSQLKPISDLSVDPTLIDSSPTLVSAIELMHEDGPWQVNEKLQKTNIVLKLNDGTYSNGWTTDFKYYNAHWNSTDQVPLELIQSGELGLFGSMNPSDGGQSGRMIVSAEMHDVTDVGYEKFSASLERYRLNLWSDFTFFELRPLTGDQFEQADNRDVISTKWIHGLHHSLLDRDSTTEIGLNLRFDDIHLGLFNTQNRNIFATVSNEHINEFMKSAWIQNMTTWSTWARTIVGLRGDQVNMQMTAFENSINSGSASAAKISPKFSAILGPWEKTEFFYNIGKGLHSNDARGVINKIDPTTGDQATQIPALVGSFGQEVGVRSQINPNLQTSLALWKLQSDSELVYSADSGIGNTSANGASVRTGLEWNNHFVANDWVFVDADLAWTHANYQAMNDNGQLGNQIPNAVGKVGILRAALHHLGPWSAGWETRYIGSYPLTQDGTQTAPAALVSNLRVNREIEKDVHLTLDVLNVFNRPYYDIAYNQDYQVSPTAQAQPSGMTVHPGEPRQVRLGIQLLF
jgi:outer membrane receptor protein involved in Fe transport